LFAVNPQHGSVCHGPNVVESNRHGAN